MANPPTYRIIQTVNPAVSTGTITATVTNTLLGSLLLVFVGCSALTDIVSTVTDNAGNSYTKAYSIATGTGGNTELWFTANAKPTTSIVITFSASVSTKSVFVREYGGMAQSVVLDQTKTASGSGTAVTTAASPSTTTAAELVVCNCSCLGTNPTNSVGAGFGNYTSQALLANLSLHSIEDLTVSSVAAQTGLMTAGGTLPVWDVGLATFVVARSMINVPYQHISVGDGSSRNEQAT